MNVAAAARTSVNRGPQQRNSRVKTNFRKHRHESSDRTNGFGLPHEKIIQQADRQASRYFKHQIRSEV